MRQETAILVGTILACHPNAPEPDQWQQIRELAEALGFQILGTALAKTGHFK